MGFNFTLAPKQIVGIGLLVLCAFGTGAYKRSTSHGAADRTPTPVPVLPSASGGLERRTDGVQASEEKGLRRVSYDLMLSGSHRSPAPVRRKNPFTGEDIEIHTYTLTEQELGNAKGVLSRRGAKDNGHGEQIVQLSDGARIQILVGSAQDGERESWSIDIQSFTADTVKFLFELASAGNFVVEDDNVAVATSAATKERLKERAPDCIVASSAEEMGVPLKHGFEAREAYVKQVTGR